MKRRRKRKTASNTFDDTFNEVMKWFFTLAPWWIAWLAFCEWYL